MTELDLVRQKHRYKSRLTMTKPVTREEKENSKREFDELNHLINNEFKGLEGWLVKTAQPKLNNLQKLIRGDLTDQDTR